MVNIKKKQAKRDYEQAKHELRRTLNVKINVT